MEIKKIYFAFAFIEIIFILGSVNAVAPNPGHALTELEKANCTTSGQFLKAIGRSVSEGYDCATPSGGGGGGWTDGTGVVYVTTSTDKVGIGTTTPAFYLDVRASVNGNVIVYGENGANADSSTAIYGISKATDKVTYGVVGLSQSSSGVGVYGKGALRGVGGTSTGTTDAAGVGVYGETTSTNGWGIFCDTPTGGGKCGGDRSWTVSSDERLKKDIKTINNPLEKVLKLRGVSFYFKGDTRNQDPHFGFIAQEVLPVVPEVISKNPEGYYAMETEELTALLVNAIKEQQATIEKQNKVIWEQHREISELRNAICEINPNSDVCDN